MIIDEAHFLPYRVAILIGRCSATAVSTRNFISASGWENIIFDQEQQTARINWSL